MGRGAVSNLKSILESHSPRSIFLVTGKGSYEGCGAKAAMEELLSGHQYVHFSDFNPNPQLDEIERGIDIYNENACDMVIAVGGGSVIDVGKSVNVLAEQSNFPELCVKDSGLIEVKGNPLVAIPTTAGSGSEATHFAVVYIGEGKDKTKYSLAHEFVLPDYAIIDPNFTNSLLGHIAASTGMDALGQAIESYWSVNSTDESRAYANRAISLAITNIGATVNIPEYTSRGAMAEAANLAGKAINISKTTAPHAMSYKFTSLCGIPHGHAVGLTLGSVLVHNAGVTEADCNDSRGVEYVRKTIGEIVSMLGCDSPEEVKDRLTSLMEYIGLDPRLSKNGVTRDDVESVVAGINPERLKNNPRVLTSENAKAMLDMIF